MFVVCYKVEGIGSGHKQWMAPCFIVQSLRLDAIETEMEEFYDRIATGGI